MNPKNKASFINSIASGKNSVCPVCGAATRPTDQTCVTCGAALSTQKTTGNAPAFASVSSSPAPEKRVQYTEPAAVFADGLPEWDIVPPQVMVRRR